jgi:BASS family bile acid:Na+ symporter
MDPAAAFDAALAAAIVAAVLGIGMAHDVPRLLAPLRRGGRLVALLAVSVLAIPALALLVATALPLDPDQRVAVVLCSAGAGGAGSLKAAQLTRGADLPLALSSVFLLQLLNLAFLPLWVGAVLDDAALPWAAVLRSLVVLIVAPLAVGLLVGARWPHRAPGWADGLDRFGSVALAVAIVLAIAGDWEALVQAMGSAVPLAAVLVVVGSGALGAAVMGQDPPRRVAAALVSAMRFAAFALLLISLNLGTDSPVMAPALAFALIELLLVVLGAVLLGRRVLGRRAVGSARA